MSLGEKIKELREKKGMNQKQVAEASGITQATISRIEKGKVKQLKSEALKRLAEALGTTVDYLVDRKENLTPEELANVDENVTYLFRGYEKLPSEARKQLIDFVQFLEGKEKEEELVRTEADARLVSAAKDLLEACKNMLWHEDKMAARKQAEAAIAKAEGR